MEEEISGQITHIVYQDATSGFTVAQLKKNALNSAPICIVGTFPRLGIGEILSCKGTWKHHPTYGLQLCVSQFTLSYPKNTAGIERYLASGVIKGIGPAFAKKIVDTFGLKTLDIMDKHPQRLSEVSGIGKKKIHTIIDHWQENSALREVLIFLRSHNIGMGIAKKIFRKYGEKSIEVLRNNPYKVAENIHGIGFKTADGIAHELGIAQDAPIRIEAGLLYTLQQAQDSGHTCYPEEALCTLAEQILHLDASQFEQALITLEDEHRIIRSPLPVQDPPVLFLWHPPLYRAEKGIATECDRLQQTEPQFRTIDVPKALDWAQEKAHIRFSAGQRAALEKSLTQKFHIITGGPGTGKSTITQAILYIHERLTRHIVLCAPTGRAAKRMSQITHKRASTIHSLLEFDPITGRFRKNREDPLKCDLIIIDEASMIDTHLMHALLVAIPDHSRIILIGDVDQLPSVGPGNVLKDLIGSQKIPSSRLWQIFRQGNESNIVSVAHDINKGSIPALKTSSEPEGDFQYICAKTPEIILEHLLKQVTIELPQAHNFNPITDIQVLSPMRRGIIGIENLNQVLQKALNPNPISITQFGRSFAIGDKVMQIRNNYTKVVFNGDVGVIQHVDKESETLDVLFDQKAITYEFTQLDELVLAYAVSIHKYQGSEAPCIVLPIHTSHLKLLQRNLLYTGITRGKRRVLLIGSQQAIALAIKNNEVHKRHTALGHFLLTECTTSQ